MTNFRDTSPSKAHLREKYKRIRAGRHRVGKVEDGRRLAQNFMESIPLNLPTTVSGYWPIHNEIDVRPLLELLHQQGHTLCLPTIASREDPLKFRQWSPSDVLRTASFGTLEPPETNPEVNPQVALVPLLAFDSRGHRLGYGGGYYDRTLENFTERRKVSVGVAYEAQFSEGLPSESKDVALNWIITEKLSRNIRNVGASK